MSLIEPIYKRPPIRNRHHREWISTLPCLGCGREGFTQAAHVRLGEGGMGLRPSDDRILPLCAPTPDGNEGCHSRQGRGERRFWEDLKFDPVFFAFQLYQATGNPDEGERLVKMARAQIAARRFGK